MIDVRLAAALCCLFALPAMAVDCPALDRQGNAQGIRIPESQAAVEATGAGRVQFYSAPSNRCVMKGVFVLPREQLTAYGTYGDFTSVMYMNPRTGDDVEGWVRSSRVKSTGYGIGPN